MYYHYNRPITLFICLHAGAGFIVTLISFILLLIVFDSLLLKITSVKSTYP